MINNLIEKDITMFEENIKNVIDDIFNEKEHCVRISDENIKDLSELHERIETSIICSNQFQKLDFCILFKCVLKVYTSAFTSFEYKDEKIDYNLLSSIGVINKLKNGYSKYGDTVKEDVVLFGTISILSRSKDKLSIITKDDRSDLYNLKDSYLDYISYFILLLYTGYDTFGETINDEVFKLRHEYSKYKIVSFEKAFPVNLSHTCNKFIKNSITFDTSSYDTVDDIFNKYSLKIKRGILDNNTKKMFSLICAKADIEVYIERAISSAILLLYNVSCCCIYLRRSQEEKTTVINGIEYPTKESEFARVIKVAENAANRLPDFFIQLLLERQESYNFSIHKQYEKNGIISYLFKLNTKLNRINSLIEQCYEYCDYIRQCSDNSVREQNINDTFMALSDSIVDYIGYCILMYIDMNNYR